MYLSVVSKAVIAAGAALIGLFSILGFGGAFDSIVKMEVLQVQRLQENTKGLEAWKNEENTVQFYFFNITNHEEFMKGAKARLNEVGPYVYKESVKKVEVNVDAANDEIHYRTSRTYEFDSDSSDGSESDRLILINVVFIANAAMVQGSVPEVFIREQMDKLLSSKGERLVMMGTVRQFLFDGIPLKAYMAIFNNAAVVELGITLPEIMQDGKFALLKNKNGSVEDAFVIKSGLSNPRTRGKVVKYNGKEQLEYWKGEACNSINGTDGSSFPPFLTKGTNLEVFSPGLCRSFSLNFQQTVEHDRMEAFRFVMDPSTWKAKSNPDNSCFCSAREDEKCDNKDGVLNVGPCTDGTPILLSQPHFLGAEEWILSSVDGLQPDPVKHITTIDFHPMTGIPVKSVARLQYSIELHQYPDMPSFSQVQHAVLPIAWFEEISYVRQDQLADIKFINLIGGILGVTHFIFIGIGAILVGTGIALSAGTKSRPSPVKPFRNDPDNAPVSAVTTKSTTKSDEMYANAFNYQ